MSESQTCAKCGAPLYWDDVHCPKCGLRRPDAGPTSAPPRGATRAMAASSVAGESGVVSCPSCGAVRLEGDLFCASCGTPIAGEVKPSRGAVKPTPPAPASPEKGSSGKPGRERDYTRIASKEEIPPRHQWEILDKGERPPPAAKDSSEAVSSESSPASSEGVDGWQDVRLQLEEATQGEFEIVKELGRGGMAAVYLARDLALDRKVAIKVMAPGLLMGAGMVDRFRQEAVTVANLHHPNIITIHTVRHAGNLHFFVMQVVEGGSLERILTRPDPIPIYLIQVIVYQLGVGLSYAHRRGVIHRDIKPANVLLDQDGNAILTDFGIAKVTTASHLTQTGATVGTPAYMSPEQCTAKELTGASDQYSLGVLAFEMLVGRPPFSGSQFEIMQAHTSTSPPSIRQGRSDCPPSLEAAVFQMLAKRPEDRFPSIADAIEAVGGYLPGPQDPIRADLARLVKLDKALPVSDRAPLKPTPGREATPVPSTRTTRPRKPSRARKRTLAWAAGAVAFAAVATVGLLSLLPSLDESPAPVATQPGPESTIRFPSPSEEVRVGATLPVQAIFEDAQGQPLPGESIEWSTSNPAVATVVGSNVEATVTGVSEGSAVIRARAGAAEGSFEVLVPAPMPSELSVSAPRREVLIGAQLALSASLTDETGAPLPDAEITWGSSNSRVLEVDSRTGRVTGRSLGRAEVTATSGDRTGSVTLTVVGRVDAVTINPPTSPLLAGGTVVLRSSVTSRPAGYRGARGLAWSSSDPSVASVSQAGADSAVISLMSRGEAVLTVRADRAQDDITLEVLPSPSAISLNLSTTSVSMEALEGGAAPEAETVAVTVTGDASPRVGPVQYGAGATGWLTPTLGATAGGRATLTLRADVARVGEGAYTASVPVLAGGEERMVAVSLIIAPNPATGPVQPTEAAAREIRDLLSAYADAINARNVTRVRELFPSLTQNAVDDLLRIRETDSYSITLSGALRLGTREGTLEGDVLTGVVGRDNRGELVRMIYTFARGQRGWYIVSLRASG